MLNPIRTSVTGSTTIRNCKATSLSVQRFMSWSYMID
jgi:hypothetical protein